MIGKWNGGHGTSGYRHTKAEREKIRISQTKIAYPRNLNTLLKTKSITQVAKELNISKGALRKRIFTYEIPHKDGRKVQNQVRTCIDCRRRFLADRMFTTRKGRMCSSCYGRFRRNLLLATGRLRS